MLSRAPGRAPSPESVSTKTVLKKVSDDSGIGSPPQSSAAWSTRDARLNASVTSTIGPKFHSIEVNGSSASETVSPPRTPLLAPPFELARSSNAERVRRRSQRVQLWLAEQQHLTEGMDVAVSVRDTKASGTPCNPYLAYPGMLSCIARKEGDDRASSLLLGLDSDRVPGTSANGPLRSNDVGNTEGALSTMDHLENNISPPVAPYAASSRNSSLRAPRPISILSISSWRNIPFATSLPRRSSPVSRERVDLSAPPQTPKKSLRPRRRSPIPETFRELDVPNILKSSHTAKSKTSSGTLRVSEMPRSSVRQRLGNLVRVHASGSSSSESPTSTKYSDSPRPSTSTSSATASTSTAVENEMRSDMLNGHGHGPSRLVPKFTISISKAKRTPPVDLSSPTHSTFSSSTYTISTPSVASQYGDVPFSSPSPLPYLSPGFAESSHLSKKRSQSNIFRDRKHNISTSALSTLSIGSIGSIATNIGGRNGSVFSSSMSAKRKKLVRFGELRQITRLPNGDLLIDFKCADVADTVCRISARVYIPGVGSVDMSWVSGKKR
ncbi:hypothetical protein EW145_g1890 [Phellinidium pouzarii]|uniref:Uncharacterized protein n=1 Tax=Phellinidium pouzarii TaxID=167371 RepID=A0A4S4LD33_9AGAM|nr:hypothetical protein EW145_g1890 [Phellinidium pouzarii]